MTRSIPTGVWGDVLRAPPDELHLTAVRIEPAAGGSFLILTREAGVEYDTWVASWNDVVDFMDTVEVEWPGHPTPTSTTP